MEKAIICVDDEKSILTGLHQQILRAYPENVLIEFAQSAEEALEIVDEFNENNIDLKLIITDQMMPGMKGHQLIEELNQKSPDVKCILLTGYAETEVIDNLNSGNLLSCLNKPWDQNELIEQIQKVLN